MSFSEVSFKLGKNVFQENWEQRFVRKNTLKTGEKIWKTIFKKMVISKVFSITKENFGLIFSDKILYFFTRIIDKMKL